jgi:membrane-associated protease RseP (regulator of RpoE activity)
MGTDARPRDHRGDWKGSLMTYVLGVVLFALGIFVSVCLHEAGHMVTAKAFGMKVTKFFAGFGPTLFSFRRGETEYGLKGIPLGGFVKIVGMTQQDDDVAQADEARAMWRFPVWKRTVVMAAGSVTHFALAFVTLWGILVFIGLPDDAKVHTEPARIAAVAPCVRSTWQIDPQTKQPVACDPAKDPKSPAVQAGLRKGDVITAVNGEATPTYDSARDKIRALGDSDATITYSRAGQEHTATVHIYAVEQPTDAALKGATSYSDIKASDIVKRGQLGFTNTVPIVRHGPVAALGDSTHIIGNLFVATFHSLKQVPQKVPALFKSLTGAQRDPNTPVSVVGASRIGGELAETGQWTNFLSLFATLNLFFGVFNLLPLLPMDGGHIAISWFERVRSWIYARLRRPDPGRVNYLKLMPFTYAIIIVGGFFVLLTVTADVVNPIHIPR